MNWLAAIFAVIPLVLPLGAFAAPEVGDPAPDFKLVGTEGKVYTLAELEGKRGVVLAWFPKPFTPG